MSIKKAIKEAEKKQEDLFLEYTDEEIKKLQKCRTRRMFWLILGIVTSFMGVGLIILIATWWYYSKKIGKIREEVYRRYLKKKKRKEVLKDLVY